MLEREGEERGATAGGEEPKWKGRREGERAKGNWEGGGGGGERSRVGRGRGDGVDDVSGGGSAV